MIPDRCSTSQASLVPNDFKALDIKSDCLGIMAWLISCSASTSMPQPLYPTASSDISSTPIANIGDLLPITCNTQSWKEHIVGPVAILSDEKYDWIKRWVPTIMQKISTAGTTIHRLDFVYKLTGHHAKEKEETVNRKKNGEWNRGMKKMQKWRSGIGDIW